MIARPVRALVAVVLYLGGGLFHLALIATGRLESYRLFDEAALLPIYETVWKALVEPSLPWIVVPVILLEWTLGLLMLGSGRMARSGQVAGAVWNVLLAPFGPWGWTNLMLAAVHAWLATWDFDRSAWDDIARRGRHDRRAETSEGQGVRSTR